MGKSTVLNTSVDIKEILLLVIYVVGTIISLIINPVFLNNSDLTITLLESQKTDDNKKHSVVQVLIQNTGSVQIHNLKVLFETGTKLSLTNFKHVEGIEGIVDNTNEHLLVNVEKISPYSYFLINAEGEISEGYKRHLIVSSDDTRVYAFEFPEFENGLISNKIFRSPDIMLALSVGTGILVSIRYFMIVRYESTRKEKFSYNLKPLNFLSPRFTAILYGYVISIFSYMAIESNLMIPFSGYKPNYALEVSDHANIFSFAELIPYDPFSLQDSQLILIAIFGICLMLALPNSKSRSIWKHEKDVSVSDITKMYESYQIIDVNGKKTDIGKKIDVVIIQNKSHILMILPVEYLDIIQMEKNTTFHEIINMKIPVKTRTGIFKLMSNSNDEQILRDIAHLKFDFLKVNPEEKILNVIKKLEDESKRFSIIMKNDDIKGVLDYKVLRG